MKRTEKSNANSSQKSKVNSWQKSKANQRTTTETKAKNDEKHFTEESCSQPVPKHPRTDADVQQGQYKRKLGEVFKTIPTIDFNVETVENKNLSFTVQKDAEVIHREIKGGTNEDHLLPQGEPVRILGKNVD